MKTTSLHPRGTLRLLRAILDLVPGRGGTIARRRQRRAALLRALKRARSMPRFAGQNAKEFAS